MAGGTWTTQNKVLPGVYANIVGHGPTPSVLGDRGVCTLPVTLPWLPEQEVFTITPADVVQLEADFGDMAIPIREAMKNARLCYACRLNKGEKAKAVLDQLTCTAKYSGTFGNRLAVSVEPVVGDNTQFHVVTWLDTDEVERQTVEDIDGLAANSWIDFSATGSDKSLAVNAGKTLEGGSDGAVSNGDYAKYLSAIEGYPYDAIGCLSDEADIKALFLAYAKRMVNDEGKYIQCVVPQMQTADFEAVISVRNGVYLEGGIHIDKVTATAYITGATAACPLNASLTNSKYVGAVDVDERFSVSEQEQLARTGQLVFIPDTDAGNNIAVIQKDINTLVTFDAKRTYAMSKNKIMRIVYTVCNLIKDSGNRFFIGKVTNNDAGRSRYHGYLLQEFKELEKLEALQDVVPEDIAVTKGTLIDAVVVDFGIRPPDVMETIYATINIYG